MLQIQRKISAYNNSGRSGNSIKYIVIHDVGTPSLAANNAHYFNGGNRDASAHYFVDDNNIIQVVEDSMASWHCGDGNGRYGITNQNSIGIEMCLPSGTVTSTTENNTVELVKYLMNKYNIDISHVVRHYDASRKMCPGSMSSNNWARWNSFKAKLVEQPKPKEEYVMKFVLVYGNDIDKRCIDYLGDVLNCPVIDGGRPCDYSNIECVIAIGGVPKNFGKFSGYTKYWLKGDNRYDTGRAVINVAEAISQGSSVQDVLSIYKI